MALPWGIVSYSSWKESGMNNICFSSRFNLLFVFEKFTTQTCILKNTSNCCWKKLKYQSDLLQIALIQKLNIMFSSKIEAINEWKLFEKIGTCDILFSSEIYWYRKGSVLPIHWDGVCVFIPIPSTESLHKAFDIHIWHRICPAEGHILTVRVKDTFCSLNGSGGLLKCSSVLIKAY